MKARNAIRISLLTVLLLLMAEREARAYTDPGSGMLIWQMLVAGFVGGMFYLRKFTSKLRLKKKAGAADTAPEKCQE